MGKRRRIKGGGRRFIQLWTNVKRSEAYHGLSTSARAALIEFLDKYTGCNNGMIAMSVRELRERLRCGNSTVERVVRELDDANLVRPMQVGTWRGRRATTWRLTFYRCDQTNDLPISNWAEWQPSPVSGTQTGGSVPPRERKRNLSPVSGTQNRKNPIKGGPLSPVSGTHIDIYQGTTGLDPMQAKARKRAGIDINAISDANALRSNLKACVKGGSDDIAH
jgi:hypothetical protein